MSNHTTFEQSLISRAAETATWNYPASRSVTTSTLWGKADYAYTYARGVISYSCPGHGGFKLSAGRQAQVPEALSHIGENGWYEEDCEWAVVAVSFPELFSVEHVKQAISSLKNYWPHAWSQFSGDIVPVEESYALRQEAFQQAHENDWVAVAARNNWDGTVHVWALLGGRRSWPIGRGAQPEKQFTIAQDDYRARGEFGYVVPQDAVEAVLI